MVHCQDCGTLNDDDAKYCTRCGAPLKEGVPYVVQPYRRGEKDEKDEKDEKQEKEETGEKYETMDADARNWVAFFGILIILAGVISLLEEWHIASWANWDTLWPFIVIVLGLWIVWNGLKARSRFPKP